MSPVLTVGITTHNERDNIQKLLDRLARLDEKSIQIIVFDDASTDGTASLIAQHPLSKQSHFEAHLAKSNFGSPSIGRHYIAQQARSPYVTYIDGDDLIDPKALTNLVRRLVPGYDIIVTPFVIEKRREFPPAFNNEQPIADSTISRLLSGIGGKIYNRKALVLHTLDEIKGRSEDVRLNIRIILGGFDRVRFEDTRPFYFIAASRKSTRAKNIFFNEVAARIKNYALIQERYGVSDTYIRRLHRALLKVAREDPSLGERDKLAFYQGLHDIMPFRLKRIIHLVQSLSPIGGISGRVRSTILAAQGREIEHICLAAYGDPAQSLPGALCAADDEAGVYAFLNSCHTTDTVVITPNNVIRDFSPPLREQLNRLPLIHMGSGQLSFILQDSPALADLDYVNNYKVSRILCLSEMDKSVHRQFGIHEVSKVHLPVATRPHNTYAPEHNRFVTYVGRIDFHAKGADRLVPIAKLMKERGLPPLRVFTTDGPNSPDLPVFLARLSEAGLSDWVEIAYNIADKEALYREASVVLLPSKKESFGNVILEAFSFGVPVIAPSYAPGPAEIIRSGQDGFLLDEFAPEAVVELIAGLSVERLDKLSQSAFARHREFSMEQYLSSLEVLAAATTRSFPGQNQVKVFPRLRAIDALTAQSVPSLVLRRLRVRQRLLAWRILLVERVIPKRVVKILRRLKARLRG